MPVRGVFPLDHEGACRDAKETFLICLEENRDKHYKCRELSKAYLQCRMDRDLMAREDLNSMGFDPSVKVQPLETGEAASSAQERVAGLAAARRTRTAWLERLFGTSWGKRRDE